MSILALRGTGESPVTAPTPSPSQVWGADQQVFSDLHCGEDIPAGSPCYIADDGLVYLAGGSGVASLADPGGTVHGYAAEEALFAQNGPVNLVDEIDWGLFDKYEDGDNYVDPGTAIYLHFGTTAKGKYDDTPTFPGQLPLGFTGTYGRARLFSALGGGGGFGYRAKGSVRGELPNEAADGARVAFTLDHTPNASGVSVYVGANNTSLYRVAPAAYTLAGNTITFGVAPTNGYKIVVDYDY